MRQGHDQGVCEDSKRQAGPAGRNPAGVGSLRYSPYLIARLSERPSTLFSLLSVPCHFSLTPSSYSRRSCSGGAGFLPLTQLSEAANWPMRIWSDTTATESCGWCSMSDDPRRPCEAGS